MHPHELGGAVREAAEAAAAARLAAWGSRYAPEPASKPGLTLEPNTDDTGFAQRLHEAATGHMSDDAGRTALLHLLAMVEELEHGLDELVTRLPEMLAAQHIGHSLDRRVTVIITGGAEVLEVRFDQRWLRTAHESNISRQTTSAFAAAYLAVDRAGIDRLIANGPLGQLLRLRDDPTGVARLLRLRDDPPPQSEKG